MPCCEVTLRHASGRPPTGILQLLRIEEVISATFIIAPILQLYNEAIIICRTPHTEYNPHYFNECFLVSYGLFLRTRRLRYV